MCVRIKESRHEFKLALIPLPSMRESWQALSESSVHCKGCNTNVQACKSSMLNRSLSTASAKNSRTYLCQSVSLGRSNAVGRRKVVILPKLLHTVKNIVLHDSALVTESVRWISDFMFHPSLTNLLG